MSVNIYCRDKGWLFEDIKKAFVDAGCVGSEYPVSAKDSWICIRSSELRKSPDLKRTLVQVHNMEPHDIDLFNASAGVVFNHPMQRWLWQREGFSNTHVVKPIGARSSVRVSNTLPERPTIGFFCGENRLLWKGSDVFQESVLEARKEVDFDCLMIGRGLQHLESLGPIEDRAATMTDYRRVDAIFCASISPGVPLSVYEAMSAGLCVITTPRWFIDPPPASVLFGSNVKELSEKISFVVKHRKNILKQRQDYVFRDYLFEDWIKENIRLINEWVAR